MSKKIVLIGNQNCGKTTLFNALTGSFQHVGNFPGVTVEQKKGFIKNYKKEFELIDLPGIYSLSPYTSEEVVAIQFLLDDHPDFIINIVDATNMERNLYLTMQLMELNIPMMLVLNMMDEVVLNGFHIDVEILKKRLGMPVIPISASHMKGINQVIEALVQTIYEPKHHFDLCREPLYEVIQSISALIEKKARQHDLPLRYAVTKLIEGDEDIFKRLDIHLDENLKIECLLKDMEKEQGCDRESILVDMRYAIIEDICDECVFMSSKTKQQVQSEKIDCLLTHRYLGIPIFIAIMLFIFYLTFYLFGAPLQDGMDFIISLLTDWIVNGLKQIGVADWLRALIGDGILAGVGSVLSFLPVIVILFFFLSLLEDSGYMARVAFVMDRSLRKIGLSGKSFVPILIGFGCSVPAIMATRTLASEHDRKMTIILTPFMSCSAKLPIYGMMISAFFSSKAILVLITIYSLGILVAVVSALLLKKTVFVGESMTFLMELPAYRIPTFQNVWLNMWDKAKDFIHKAFTVIFIASIVIWFLQSFNFHLVMVEDSQQSILAWIGIKLAPFFKPLGFSDWRASTALLTGITAKESVVSTLMILTSSASSTAFNSTLVTIFTPLSALSFLVFTALYMPCVAAFAATKKEFHSWYLAVLTAVFQTSVAYMVAFVIYQVGSLWL